MKYVENCGARLRWHATGPIDAPAVVLLNSIGTDMSLWDIVIPSLSDLHVIRMDTRGHGGSDAPHGDYSLAMLADDVVAVMDDANVSQAIVAGVSLGGMIAIQLALDHPERVKTLLAICTSAAMDSTAWADRVRKVRHEGMAAIVDLAMSRFLSPDFVARNAAVAGRVKNGLLGIEPAGYAGCAAAIRDMAIAQRLHELDLPATVVSGSFDTSTPFLGHGDRLLADIPGAGHVELPCAHLAPIEEPEQLARVIRDIAAVP